MRPFTRKQFCKISSDRSNITSDGRHLSSDGPSYVANLPGNFALASYPFRHIHVLPKDELSKKFPSQRRSSACYTESGRYRLRGGTAALEVETGRWRGVSREGRVCRNCRSEEVENVEHWLLRCTGMAEEREKLIRTMREKVEWQSMEDDERVAAVLSYACRDDGVGRGVEKMWRKRFFDRSLTVPAPPPPPPLR